MHVFDYYKTNGTLIPNTAIYQSNSTQLVSNTGFETNVAGWYVFLPSSGSVTIGQDTTQHLAGAASLKISGRAAAGDVPATDLSLMAMRNGDTYQIQMPAYAKSTGTVQGELVLVSDGGTQTFTVPSTTFHAAGGWVTSQGNVTINWTGVLHKATLTLVSSDNTANINIDQVSLTDTSLPGNAYVTSCGLALRRVSNWTSSAPTTKGSARTRPARAIRSFTE